MAKRVNRGVMEKVQRLGAHTHTLLSGHMLLDVLLFTLTYALTRLYLCHAEMRPLFAVVL